MPGAENVYDAGGGALAGLPLRKGGTQLAPREATLWSAAVPVKLQVTVWPALTVTSAGDQRLL